jgi:hypothetical protein
MYRQPLGQPSDEPLQDPNGSDMNPIITQRGVRNYEPLGPAMTGAPWEDRYSDAEGAYLGTNRNRPRVGDRPVEYTEPPLPLTNQPTPGGPVREWPGGDENGAGTELYRQRTPRPGTDRPIQNPDGSVTTERSITVTEPGLNGGRPTNIPTVWDGRIVSDDEAVDNAIRSGVPFPSFDSIPEAVRAAEQRSKDLGAGRERSIGGTALPYDSRDMDAGPHEQAPAMSYRQPLGEGVPLRDRWADDPAQQPASTYNDPTTTGTQHQPIVALPTTYGASGDELYPMPAWAQEPSIPSVSREHPGNIPSLDPGGAQFAAQDAFSTPPPVLKPATRPWMTPDATPQPAQSPLKPVWDAAGNVVGAIHTGATGIADQIGSERGRAGTS